MKPFPAFTTIIIVLVMMVNYSCSSRLATKESFIKNQGVKISYLDYGKGDTTLFFVHGWCINKGYWLKQVNYFKKNYRVVAIDLPGFGNSGKNRVVWSAAAYGTDVNAVISKLHLKNVVLIGHSMAGDIVLDAALKSPGDVIAIVGVDNFKNVGHINSKSDSLSFNEAISALRHRFRKIAFEYFNESLFSKTTADSIKRRVLGDVAAVDTTIATDCMQASGTDEIKELTAVKKKLYLINSDVQLTNGNSFKKYNIPYEAKFIHGTGHFPMIESPQEFNAALAQIINDIPRK